ncbi:MAG TPA: hypothetical protein VE077_04595 [Candidatus Methylomirabilis sp.]|nr:hypothetical protein [Candidatus Methylomirabilis sp.]
MWPSRIAVATDVKRIQLKMEADARLAAAAGGAARFFGDAAGLEGGPLAQLQSTVIAACSEEFQHLDAAHPQLQVTFSRFTDRIEVTLAHEGENATPERLDALRGLVPQMGGKSGGSGALEGVDRVQFETHGRSAILRLTKFLHSPASAA